MLGERRYLPGCPAKHVDAQTQEWFSSYRWFKMGKTPVELGFITFDEWDPRWFEAMELIESEIARLEAARIKKK